jgi:hypothetical protein
MLGEYSRDMKGDIVVAYSGVHQAFQLALAAEELGQLDRFYCSLYAAESKWGGWLSYALGNDTLLNRRVGGLSTARVCEYPWPFLSLRVKQAARLAGVRDWEEANFHFDKWVARQLQRNDCFVFVGVETCAAESFLVARERGMIRVLDCPGIESSFLDNLALEAAAEFGLATSSQADSNKMREHKCREFELADVILVSSELQARTLYTNAPSTKFQVIPLWIDTQFWQPLTNQGKISTGHLRVLFVGKVNLRKGIPYLVQAAIACGGAVTLTLVGNVDTELKTFLKPFEGKITLLPTCTKTDLLQHYNQHDVLVLPSLGDSFGFVAMEAMACGLPVIISENCGVPVPDPAWRVPVMDSAAIANRLTHYAMDIEAAKQDGRVAQQFARQFTPGRYREQIKKLYRKLLETPAT